MRLFANPSHWVPVLVLLLVPPAVHAPLWLLHLSADPLFFTSTLGEAAPRGLLPGQPGWLDPNAGLTTEALGGFAARAWLHGRVPWWNPLAGVGMPLAAEMQPAALFLPFTLLLALPHGVLLNKLALQIVGGLAALALLRDLGLARRVALLGGILFELNGTFAWYSHAPINPLPFLPLLLLGIERAARAGRAGAPGGFGWVAVGVAGSLYAGFPEVAFIDGLLAAAWAGWRAVGGGSATVRKIAAGGVLGLLLAAPVTLPFLQDLATSFVGSHAAIGDAPLEPTCWALLLVPYVQGPLGTTTPWFLVGGYLGLPMLGVGLLALTRRGTPARLPHAGLRWVLAGWIALAMAKTAQWPGAAALFDLVPFVRQAAFYLYAVPSYAFALLVLACLALDDWLRLGPPPRAASLGAAAIVLLGLARALWLAAGVLRPLLHADHLHAAYVVASLGAALGAWLLAAGLLWDRRGPRRAVLPGLVLVAYAALVFALPLLSGTRKVPIDRAAIAFLQANLGLARFYTLGPLQPNWGTNFGLASINHNVLPVPARWVDYIRAHLDPGADDVNFTGNYPAPVAGEQTRAEALAQRLPAYAEAGVRFVLTPAGVDPFAAPRLRVPATGAPPDTVALRLGESLFGGVPAASVPGGRLASVAVAAGGAAGAVRLDICTPRDCTSGVAATGAGGALTVPLMPPLTVLDGDEMRWLLVRTEGAEPLPVPLWPQAAADAAALVAIRTPAGLRPGVSPDLTLAYLPPVAAPPPRVYGDAILDIYELPHPAPYFAADAPGCVLAPAGREALAADCPAPTTLVRREMFDPGWRAEVNGAAAPVAVAQEIFQAVPLPAGHAEVRFRYAPPGIGWAWAAAALGVAALLAGRPWRGTRGRPPDLNRVPAHRGRAAAVSRASVQPPDHPG